MSNLVSNSAALMSVLMVHGLTVTKAARMAGLDYNTFKVALAGGGLSVKTASKLVKAFGDDVVMLANPRQRELQQLKALRAEFADRYPDDSARLAVLDEMIQDAENTGGNHDA